MQEGKNDRPEKTEHNGENNKKKRGVKAVLQSLIKNCGPVLPAICLALLVVFALGSYEKPAVPSVISHAEENTVTEEVSADEEEDETPESMMAGSFDKEDGVYRGTGIGYGGEIVVDVTIVDHSITQIEIVEAFSETASFFDKAKGVIPSILSSQSLEVDTVSGATYSSRGIIDAVKNALTGEEAQGETAEETVAAGSPDVSHIEEGEYRDGTYVGSATGFGGTIKVQVTVKKGKITKITVLDASGETPSYFGKARAVIGTIVKKQTTNVDTVSGATYSSAGIIKAVRSALSKAKVKQSGKSKTKKTSKKKKTKKNAAAKAPKTSHAAGAAGDGVPYDDGVYYGSGYGFGGTTTVAVTIKDGKITDITVVSHQDDKDYFNKASNTIISKVIKQQNTNVDAVSGATFSSEGILAAVDDALAAAEKATKEKKSSAGGSGTSGNSGSSSGADGSDTADSDSSDKEPAAEGVVYKNGTYSATAVCYPDEWEDFWDYTITVTLTIETDAITDVTVTANSTDDTNETYTNRAARTIKTQLMANGNADGIDTVSGATCSSNAIIRAAQDALTQAKR